MSGLPGRLPQRYGPARQKAGPYAPPARLPAEAVLPLPGVIGTPAGAAPRPPLDDAARRTVRRLIEEAGLL
ncbi:hypothetical protein QOM21_06945 [Streptomyces sp. Pv4-95]|uniref:hypothetical protein n=1 Tax=Streptomyces sp. Pv4-95 TaxID=3049543 RepID=UPI00389270F0